MPDLGFALSAMTTEADERDRLASRVPVSKGDSSSQSLEVEDGSPQAQADRPRKGQTCCTCCGATVFVFAVLALADPGGFLLSFRVGLLAATPSMPDFTVAEDVPGRRLRFVAISDTHGRHRDISVPDGDVLLHAGDLTYSGTPHELREFNEWMGTLPHRHKIVIAGNHDFTLDSAVCTEEAWAELGSYRSVEEPPPECNGIEAARSLLTNCTYMTGGTVSVEGLNVYAAPEQIKIPVVHRMAFNLDDEEAMERQFAPMPLSTDVLLTHSPPHGVGRLDRMILGKSVGSTSLRDVVTDRGNVGRLQWSVFGHIHEGYGATTIDGVTFINAANVNLRYRYTHPPVVFDVQLPDGVTTA